MNRSFLGRWVVMLLGLACGALLGLTACSSSVSLSRKVLRVGLETDPLHLDPRYALDAASYRVIQLLYNGLVRLDAHARVVPDLATSWETPDATTYVFHLRHGVRFHDGTLLTAADVYYTFTSLLDPAMQSPKRGSFDKIRAIEVLSEDTIRFVLSEPFAPFLTNNMTLGIVPRPRSGDAVPPDQHPIGTGPFAFERREPNVALYLRAHEAYFEGKPALDGIVLRILPDAMVRLFELQKGNIDLLQNALPPDVLVQLRDDPRFQILQVPGTNFVYLGLNCRDPILRHVRVRQALAYAIDRQALIQHVLRGLARPADGILPAGHWAYTAQVPRYRFDPARAAQLLDAAGFPDPDGPGKQPRFRLLYKTSQDAVGQRIAEVIQESLRRIGVAIDIRSYEWGTFFGDIRAGNFQLYALTWVGVTEPDIFYYVFHSKSIPPAGANRGRCSDPRLDRLLEQGRRAMTLEERRGFYGEAQRIIATELPYIPLWHQTNVAVLRTTFTNYYLSPAGNFRALQAVRWRPAPTPSR
jgi:peptide/nickel transport system substrate-binding protein